MSRILLALMFVCILGIAGWAFAQEGAGGPGYPANGDPWNAVPQPSGMRFATYDDALANWGGYGGGGCNCKVCAHWTQYSWYATWGYDNLGGGNCGTGGCGPAGCGPSGCGPGGCGNTTGYGCRKHQHCRECNGGF